MCRLRSTSIRGKSAAGCSSGLSRCRSRPGGPKNPGRQDGPAHRPPRPALHRRGRPQRRPVARADVHRGRHNGYRAMHALKATGVVPAQKRIEIALQAAANKAPGCGWRLPWALGWVPPSSQIPSK